MNKNIWLKRNKGDLERPQKEIDTTSLPLLKIVQLFCWTMFRWTHNLKVMSGYVNHPVESTLSLDRTCHVVHGVVSTRREISIRLSRAQSAVSSRNSFVRLSVGVVEKCGNGGRQEEGNKKTRQPARPLPTDWIPFHWIAKQRSVNLTREIATTRRDATLRAAACPSFPKIVVDVAREYRSSPRCRWTGGRGNFIESTNYRTELDIAFHGRAFFHRFSVCVFLYARTLVQWRA